MTAAVPAAREDAPGRTATWEPAAFEQDDFSEELPKVLAKIAARNRAKVALELAGLRLRLEGLELMKFE